MQVYTGYWLDTPRKVVHGGPDVNYTKWSAVAIEQEGYIDAINTPEWGVDQICEPPHSRNSHTVRDTHLELAWRRLPGEGLRVGVGVQVLHCPMKRYLQAGVLVCRQLPLYITPIPRLVSTPERRRRSSTYLQEMATRGWRGKKRTAMARTDSSRLRPAGRDRARGHGRVLAVPGRSLLGSSLPDSSSLFHGRVPHATELL